ncbi:MAG: bestrophin family ion channel [Thiohalocapsa sp.]
MSQLAAAHPRLFSTLATLVSALHDSQRLNIPEFSLAPFTLLGVALSIFLGFRNNAAHVRWWEARKQWGKW